MARRDAIGMSLIKIRKPFGQFYTRLHLKFAQRSALIAEQFVSCMYNHEYNNCTVRVLSGDRPSSDTLEQIAGGSTSAVSAEAAETESRAGAVGGINATAPCRHEQPHRRVQRVYVPPVSHLCPLYSLPHVAIMSRYLTTYGCMPPHISYHTASERSPTPTSITPTPPTLAPPVSIL